MSEQRNSTQTEAVEGQAAALEQSGSSTKKAGTDTETTKTFTQDEVNKIVSERLARERTKVEPDPIEARESQLAAREAAMSCKEYIKDVGYPEGVLELFDTSNIERFKQSVAKLLELAPSLDPKVAEEEARAPVFTRPLGSGFGGASSLSAIAEAFKRKD